jgi:hypothetical protein
LDTLWQVDINPKGDPICESWTATRTNRTAGPAGPQVPMWRFVLRPDKNSMASREPPWRANHSASTAQQGVPLHQQPVQTTALPPAREAAAEVPHRPEPLRTPLAAHRKSEEEVRGEAHDRRVESTRKRTKKAKELLREKHIRQYGQAPSRLQLERHEYALDSQKIGGSQSGTWLKIPENPKTIGWELRKVGIKITTYLRHLANNDERDGAVGWPEFREAMNRMFTNETNY